MKGKDKPVPFPDEWLLDPDTWVYGVDEKYWDPESPWISDRFAQQDSSGSIPEEGEYFILITNLKELAELEPLVKKIYPDAQYEPLRGEIIIPDRETIQQMDSLESLITQFSNRQKFGKN